MSLFLDGACRFQTVFKHFYLILVWVKNIFTLTQLPSFHIYTNNTFARCLFVIVVVFFAFEFIRSKSREFAKMNKKRVKNKHNISSLCALKNYFHYICIFLYLIHIYSVVYSHTPRTLNTKN